MEELYVDENTKNPNSTAIEKLLENIEATMWVVNAHLKNIETCDNNRKEICNLGDVLKFLCYS